MGLKSHRVKGLKVLAVSPTAGIRHSMAQHCMIGEIHAISIFQGQFETQYCPASGLKNN